MKNMLARQHKRVLVGLDLAHADGTGARHRACAGPPNRNVLAAEPALGPVDGLLELAECGRTLSQDTHYCHTVSDFTAFSPNRIGEYDSHCRVYYHSLLYLLVYDTRRKWYNVCNSTWTENR